MFFQNITRTALWIWYRGLNNIRASCVSNFNMAARLATFSRLLTQSQRHVLANCRSSQAKFLAIQRNSLACTRMGFSRGSFERSILGCNLIKYCLVKSRTISTSSARLSSSSGGNTTLGKI